MLQIKVYFIHTTTSIRSDLLSAKIKTEQTGKNILE